MNISLIGMMGSGKTTIGKLLATELKYKFIDTDSLVEETEKKTINEIFAINGEEYFRQIETNILINVLNNNKQVISTGGGIIKEEVNIKNLKEKSIVIYLQADEKTLFERVKDNNERPLLNVQNMKEKITTLLLERKSKYEQAHITINTENKSKEEIIKEILGKIHEYSRN